MESELSLKLYIDSASQKLVYAEANKDFVDFLFGLLALPIGAVTELITKEDMVGCIGDVFNSLESLDKKYLKTNSSNNSIDELNKELLKSLIRVPNSHIPSLLQPCIDRKYYICHCFHRSFSDISGAKCSRCSSSMTTEAKFDHGGNHNPGLAKDFNYTVLDDLSVRPLSSSIMKILIKFQLKDITDVQEMIVKVGYDEAVAILKASLQSKTVLSDVFLDKQNNKKEEHEVKKEKQDIKNEN